MRNAHYSPETDSQDHTDRDMLCVFSVLFFLQVGIATGFLTLDQVGLTEAMNSSNKIKATGATLGAGFYIAALALAFPMVGCAITYCIMKFSNRADNASFSTNAGERTRFFRDPPHYPHYGGHHLGGTI